MDEIEVRDEYYMLRGNIHRMFVTHNKKGLFQAYNYAKKRLKRIYEYHCTRINNE